MAITGISAISGQQIIASGACSARSAATASYTTGGNDIQGLYTTVNSNSGNWNTPLFPSNITADSLYINNNGDITLLQQTGDDSDDYAQTVIHGSGIEFINGQIDPTVVGTIAGNDVSNWNSTMDTVSSNSAAWAVGGVDSATVSAIASSYAESATSGLQPSGDYYSASNPSGFITGIPDPLTVNEIHADSIQITAEDTAEQNIYGVWIDSAGISIYGTAGYGYAGINLTTVTNWDDTYNTLYYNSGAWDNTTNTVNTNSGAWGGSALPISAGNGIALSVVNGTLVISLA